ncbi:CD177 antigen-like [Peromyscus californicus insignis]|uniref:CD177 antigen-like n=1 Tax=Peromyscus californicus insignis TaxID=564181 RepID=UPI0022A6DDBF|nr:CD177 antigen-like [Peromyscus californicus insignis]
MAACCIQYFLLFFLLGFTHYSDTLICKEGVMVTFGSGFPKTVVDWTSQGTKIAGPKEACYETLVLIDVGPKSLLVGSKGTGISKDEDVHNIRMYDYSGVGIYPDNGTVLMYSYGPGILAAMYHETCHADLCNSDNTTRVLLRGLHIATSDQSKNNRCPVCLHYWGSCRKNFVFCPKDTGCYDGEIAIEGGECWRLHPQDEGDRGHDSRDSAGGMGTEPWVCGEVRGPHCCSRGSVDGV